jgi:hypothetical protein
MIINRSARPLHQLGNDCMFMSVTVRDDASGARGPLRSQKLDQLRLAEERSVDLNPTSRSHQRLRWIRVASGLCRPSEDRRVVSYRHKRYKVNIELVLEPARTMNRGHVRRCGGRVCGRTIQRCSDEDDEDEPDKAVSATPSRA